MQVFNPQMHGMFLKMVFKLKNKTGNGHDDMRNNYWKNILSFHIYSSHHIKYKYTIGNRHSIYIDHLSKASSHIIRKVRKHFMSDVKYSVYK